MHLRVIYTGRVADPMICHIRTSSLASMQRMPLSISRFLCNLKQSSFGHEPQTAFAAHNLNICHLYNQEPFAQVRNGYGDNTEER